MALDIAVCIDEDGLASSLYEGSKLVIYQKNKVLGELVVRRPLP